MRGRDGNVHRGKPADGILPMISHLGAMIPVVNGILFAHRAQGIANTVGATCLGDGGMSTGAFHEGMNQAAVERLPLVMVVANNQFAYSTPNEHQFACASLVDRAIGYGVVGHSVDGTDLKACFATVEAAVQAARSGQGPQLIVANLLRLCGHGEHDDASYITDAVKQTFEGRDCIKVGEQQIRESQAMSDDDLTNLKSECITTVDQAVATAQREPAPDPYDEDWKPISSTHLIESRE